MSVLGAKLFSPYTAFNTSYRSHNPQRRGHSNGTLTATHDADE